jgi:hypothetical protein
MEEYNREAMELVHGLTGSNDDWGKVIDLCRKYAISELLTVQGMIKDGDAPEKVLETRLEGLSKP